MNPFAPGWSSNSNDGAGAKVNQQKNVFIEDAVDVDEGPSISKISAVVSQDENVKFMVPAALDDHGGAYSAAAAPRSPVNSPMVAKSEPNVTVDATEEDLLETRSLGSVENVTRTVVVEKHQTLSPSSSLAKNDYGGIQPNDHDNKDIAGRKTNESDPHHQSEDKADPTGGIGGGRETDHADETVDDNRRQQQEGSDGVGKGGVGFFRRDRTSLRSSRLLFDDASKAER